MDAPDIATLDLAATPGLAGGAVLSGVVLDDAGCERIAERLFDLDAFWLRRHPRFPFHTLGATHYYDLLAGTHTYERRWRQYNPFLHTHFAGLYERLIDVLQRLLEAPVCLREDAASPGFQIFAAHPEFADNPSHDVMHPQWLARRHEDAYPGNPIHVDTSHLCLRWPQGIDARRQPTASFTLPIVLPSCGAGLRLWPCTDADPSGPQAHESLAALPRLTCRQVSYRPGELVLHSGRQYHQARGLPSRAGDHRITLQGNALRVDGVWQLHW